MPRKKKAEISVLHIASVMLLASVCFSPPTFATTFVALTTDLEGILALDSRRTSTLNGHLLSQTPMCKILTGKRSLYAIAGMSGAGDLNAYKIIEPLATDRPTALVTIRDALLTMLQKGVPHMSEEELARFINTSTPLTVVIAVAFDKVASLQSVLFYLNPDRSIRSEMVSQKNPAQIFSEKEVQTLFPQNWPALEDKIPLVRSLMSAGIAANPASGGPISLVKVNAYGLQWIETGACTVRR